MKVKLQITEKEKEIAMENLHETKKDRTATNKIKPYPKYLKNLLRIKGEEKVSKETAVRKAAPIEVPKIPKSLKKHSTPVVAPEKSVIGYVRISTGEQAEKWGPEQQKETIRIYSEVRGISIGKIFTDVASGQSDIRTDLQKILAMAKRNEVRTLIVSTFNRLGRNPEDLRSILKKLLACGVRIIACDEKLDTGHPPERQLMSMACYQVGMETGMRNSNLESGRIAAIQNGLPGFGINPYGYRWENGDFVIVEEEAKVVHRMFELYAGDISERGIAKLMNNENIPSPRGGEWKQRTVGRILSNPIYIGVLVRSIHKDVEPNYKKSYEIIEYDLHGKIAKKWVDFAQKERLNNR